MTTSVPTLWNDHQIRRQPFHGKGHLLLICACIAGLECIHADQAMSSTVSLRNPFIINMPISHSTVIIPLKWNNELNKNK